MTIEQKIAGIALVVMFLFIGLLKLLPRLVFSGASPVGALFRYLKYLWNRRRNRDGIWLHREWISDQARLRHTHIVGSTGTGKSVLMEHLIARDIERGLGMIIIDPKGDRELYNRVKDAALRSGRPNDLILLSAERPHQSAVWNPCGFGDVSQLQTKFYNACTYAEPHYAKAVELGLLSIFQTLAESFAEGFGLKEVVDELNRRRQENKNNAMDGLYLDLQSIYQSEWGTILNPKEESIIDGKEISIVDVIKNGKILFIDLPTESKAIQSRRLGRLILSEIVNISGFFKTNPNEKPKAPFSVYVDEFDAFATEGFSTFLNKGRSSNFMIHMAHQTLSDLREVSDTFMGKIMGNVNVRFIFRQDDPDDAEVWSRLFGTKEIEISTHRVEDGAKTGDASLRTGQQFLVSPNIIKSLGVGRCLFSIKGDKVLKQLKIPPPNNHISNIRDEERTLDLSRFRRSFRLESLPSKTRSRNIASARFDGIGAKISKMEKTKDEQSSRAKT